MEAAARTALEEGVGKLMHEFNMIEVSLVQIFSTLIGLSHMGSDAFVAGELMYSTNSFDARVNLIERLFKLRLPKKSDHRRERWVTIRAALMHVKKFRNAAAHGLIGTDNARGGIAAILAGPHSSQFGKAEGSVSISELKAAIAATREVSISLAKFSWDFSLEGWRESPSETATSTIDSQND